MIASLPEGYDTVIGESGVTLSEGEKQRITIARALLRDAPILILDEPTSALDVATEALVMAGIERLMAARTTFIIAHRLSTVRRCDRIIVLRDGAIAEEGTLPELLRRDGIFAEYYRTQFAPEAEARRRDAPRRLTSRAFAARRANARPQNHLQYETLAHLHGTNHGVENCSDACPAFGLDCHRPTDR